MRAPLPAGVRRVGERRRPPCHRWPAPVSAPCSPHPAHRALLTAPCSPRAAHRTLLTARWGPRAGDVALASTRSAGPRLTLLRAGYLTVTRTCVLIKKASQRGCTCVLITCMSQAAHGLWPRSDHTFRHRQNGAKCSYLVLPGAAGRVVTPGNLPRGRPGAGARRRARREPGVGPTIRTGAGPVRFPRPRSLLKPGTRPQQGKRAPAGQGASPRSTTARSPCSSR